VIGTRAPRHPLCPRRSPTFTSRKTLRPRSLGRPCAESLCWRPRRDSQTIPSKPSTADLGTSPRLKPVRLKHLQVRWKRAPWHASPAQAGVRQRARRAPHTHTHNSHSSRSAPARSAETQELFAQSSAPAVPGGRHALTRVRDDTIHVRANQPVLVTGTALPTQPRAPPRGTRLCAYSPSAESAVSIPCAMPTRIPGRA